MYDLLAVDNNMRLFVHRLCPSGISVYVSDIFVDHFVVPMKNT